MCLLLERQKRAPDGREHFFPLHFDYYSCETTWCVCLPWTHDVLTAIARFFVHEVRRESNEIVGHQRGLLTDPSLTGSSIKTRVNLKLLVAQPLPFFLAKGGSHDETWSFETHHEPTEFHFLAAVVNQSVRHRPKEYPKEQHQANMAVDITHHNPIF